MAERLFLRLDGDPLYAPETSVPAGTLRAFAVDPRLAGHVAHVTGYREDIPTGQERTERVLPDGAVHLVFHLGGTGFAAAAGPGTAPALLRFSGRVEGLSVTLRPGAAAALLGVPAGEISGTAVPLDALWGADGRSLVARLGEAADEHARHALLQQFLCERLGGASGPSPALHAARMITRAGGQRALREVADELGIGERRLQQLFHAEVGLTPRSFSRVARLHACLRALRRASPPRWAELAVDAGYFDQSHLANEFQALCGLSPGLFLSRAISGSSKTAG